MIYSGLLVVAVLAAYLLQDAVASFAGAALAICGVGPAALEWMHHGRLLLLPALFFAACVTVPFPGMLALAFACGFLWDCSNALVWGPEFYLLAGGEGPGFGAGPILFGLLGCVVHGVRPVFLAGARVVAVVAGGLGTFLLLLCEYHWISFRAGHFAFPDGFWVKVGCSTAWAVVASLAIVPLLVAGLRASGHGDGMSQPWNRP